MTISLLLREAFIFKALLLFTIFWTQIVWAASQWTSIRPLPHCSLLTIEYQYVGDKYRVRYRKQATDLTYTVEKKLLENINDLSSLTDELIEAAYSYCPFEMNIDEIERLCADVNPTSPFDQEYVDFLREFVVQIDKEGNNCDDVIPYMRLQSTVSALKQEELIKFDRSKNILKLFTGSDTDKLIDQVRECGGSTEGTRQFIQNIILIEARNACIFPSYLSFEEATAIAKKVSEKYPGMGLLGLNSAKERITRDTIKAMVEPILDKQIKAIAGNEIDTSKIITGLPSVKKIDTISDSRLQDYTSLVLGPDIPFEIVDSLLPTVVEKSFSPMLEELSSTDRNRFLQESLLEPIQNDYANCVGQYKDRLRFHDKGLSDKNIIRHRKNLRDQFCEQNPESCNAVGCDAKTNFLTLRDDINDQSLIQSCLYQSINERIPSIIELNLGQQLDNLPQLDHYKSSIINSLTHDASTEIKRCFENTSIEVTQKPYTSQTKGHPEALLHLSADQYKDTLLDCAKKIEMDITTEIASLLVADTEPFRKLFPENGLIENHGVPLNKLAYDQAKSVVTGATNQCFKSQLRTKKLQEIDSGICIPLIEMRAGQTIITSQISSMLKEHDIAKRDINSLSFNYQLCADEAFERALNQIKSSEQAQVFLDNDQAFLNCVNNTILDAVDLVSENSYKKILKEQSDGLDTLFANTLTPEIKKAVHQCFKDGLETNNNWNQFIAFNEQGGIKKLQNDCTEVAENYALPRLIKHELSLQLGNLQDTNAVNIPIENFIKSLASDKDVKSDGHEILLGLYLEYKDKNQKSDIEGFINEFKQIAQEKAIEEIHKHILQELVERNKIGFPLYKDLVEILTPKCMNDLYSLHKENVALLIKRIAAQEPKPEEQVDIQKIFIEILEKGLFQALVTGQYKKLLDTAKKMCEGPQDFATLQSLADSQVGDDFIAAIVREKLIEAFNQTAVSQCEEDMNKMKIPSDVAMNFCDPNTKSKQEFNTLAERINSLFGDPKITSNLRFIWERKVQTVEQAGRHFRQRETLELFIKDRTVLDFIYKNFSDVVTHEPKVNTELTRIVVDKIFKDHTKGKFAEEFIELQLVSAIGIKGYEKAHSTMLSKIEEMTGPLKSRDFVKQRAREFGPKLFPSVWSYSGVQKHFNWENLQQPERDELINAVYKLNIAPRFQSDNNKQELEDYGRKLESIVYDHIENHRSIPNPNYVPAKKVPIYTRGSGSVNFVEFKEVGPKDFTFAESLAEDLTQRITIAVENDIYEDIGEKIKNSILKWPHL